MHSSISLENNNFDIEIAKYEYDPEVKIIFYEMKDGFPTSNNIFVTINENQLEQLCDAIEKYKKESNNKEVILDEAV
jgi:hypothetical protein